MVTVPNDRAVDVILSEFSAARSEIDRKNAAYVSLLGLYVTGVGAVGGFVISNHASVRLLLILPILGSALGLAVMGESRDRKITGMYIVNELRPLLVEYAGDDRLLRWELFYREHGGRGYRNRAVAMGLLFPGISIGALVVTIGQLMSIGDWIAWLIGCSLVAVLTWTGLTAFLRDGYKKSEP
jgi:hypothetical protein